MAIVFVLMIHHTIQIQIAPNHHQNQLRVVIQDIWTKTMTANAYPEAAVKASNSGMTDFTTKPLDSKRLRTILEVYAAKRK